MKRLLTIMLAAALGLATAGAAMAIDTYNSGEAAGGIASSRHNLGSFSMHVASTSTTEICVFCHTPHHTNNGAAAGSTAGLAPLWNRGTQSVSNFTAYGTTLAGTVVTSSDLGSVSLACLSCHDGVTTFDNLANAPGKDGVTANGSEQGWNFLDIDTLLLGPGVVMNPGRLVIGLDLSNDHPMSVVYSGGVKASLRTTDTVISTIDLTTGLAASAVYWDNGNLTKNLWSINGYINQNAAISDLLRGPNADRVECSSCHDPHFNNKSWNEVDHTFSSDVAVQETQSDGLFLRRVGGNTGSGVCRTCHGK